MPLASNTSSMVTASRSIDVLAKASANRSPMKPGLTPTPNRLVPPAAQAASNIATRSSPCAAG